MTNLTPPEWSGPFATGLFGTAYGLGDGRSLVLVGAPGNVVGSRPDRTWLWVIMKGRATEWTRDFAFEETLRTNEDLAALAAVQVIDGDRLFTAREKDLGKVLRILREAARAGTGCRPGRKAAL
jgi:hypothetical protein